MMIRNVLSLLNGLTVALALLASGASAQTQPTVNVFFGFDYGLVPLGLKWSCGGASEQDLAQLSVLISAYPDDAKAAEIQESIDLILELSTHGAGLPDVIGYGLSSQQIEQLCAAALPLDIDWLTPERLANDGDPPAEKKEAWDAFFQTIENLR